MPDQTIKKWIDSRLDVLSRDWKSKADDLGKVEKDINNFLRPVLDSLGYPYTIDATTGESVVVVTPEISIIGRRGYDTYDFKAKLNKFTKKEVLICNPYISAISVYVPLLKQAIQDLQTLSVQLTPQTKLNKQSELLASIIVSYLKELNAPDLVVKPLCHESACCKLSYNLFPNLNITRTVDFKNYIHQCESFVNLVTADYDKTLHLLESRPIKYKSFKRSKHGEQTKLLWHGEPRQIKYCSQEIQEMITPAPRVAGNGKIAKALRECEYKYYFKNGLWVVLNDEAKIFRDDDSCFLVKKDEYFVKWRSNIDYVTREEFALLLRIIAALPLGSVAELTKCHSFGNMVYKQLAEEVRKHLLPNYCSIDFSYNGGDLVIFSDRESFSKNEFSGIGGAVYLQHDKRYISRLWSLITNADILRNLFVSGNVEA